MFSSLVSKLVLLTLTATFSLLAQSGYTAWDLRGTYAFSFQGTLIQGSAQTAIPFAAVGVFTLDGEGRVTKATRILNVSGQVVRQTATGTYTVNAEGIGSAVFNVIPAAGEPPVVPATREVFHIAMVSRRVGLALSGSILAINGQDIGLLSIAKAEFTRQD
jgi:hypothetical protein